MYHRGDGSRLFRALTRRSHHFTSPINMTDETQRRMYALMAHNRIQTLRGLAFQDFFSDVAEHAFPGDFVRVRPAGKIGDKKCDGYLPSSNRVYACYAPRDLKPKALQSKIMEDFDGAIDNWPDIQEWCFVHNDTDGLDAGSLELLNNIGKDNPKIAIQILNPLDIKTLILGLSADSLVDLFGEAADSRAMTRFGYPEIEAIVDAVSAANDGEIAPADIIAPSSKKLVHNALGGDIAELLKLGEVKAPQFRRYFSETSKEMQGESIANWFRAKYRSLEENGYEPSHIFHELVHDAGGLTRPKNEQAAVLGLLSYLFHTCDIFRDDE